MSFAPSSLTKFGSRLPYELIELIILEAWLSHNFTFRERMDMFTSFSLVSLDFAWEFTRVFMAHVHIFTRAHYKHYIHCAYHNDTDFLRMMKKLGRCLDARTACRSITTHLVSVSDDDEISMSAILDNIACIIPAKFPRVHHFGIVYHDWTLKDGNISLLSLPKQVDVLEVTHVMSAKLASHSRENDFTSSTCPRKWRFSASEAVLPHIQRLEIYGGNTSLMIDLTRACPNVKVVVHNCHELRGISCQT
ncbi:hypothetical protein CPB85DRAFT_1252564 [Mucidula mucida]|nr:hypothetical protein CPB85DRAFT_1252564 [Mucidula mucida]